MTDHIKVQHHLTPDTAPNYDESTNKIDLQETVIIQHGTEQGNPTVDLVFTDNQGRQHVCITKGGYILSLAEIMLENSLQAKPTEGTIQ